MKNTKEFKNLLLEAPDGHLSATVLDVIRTWADDAITAANVLEALDTAVYSGGASNFGMGVLNRLLQTAIAVEKTTYDEVVKNATWRFSIQ